MNINPICSRCKHYDREGDNPVCSLTWRNVGSPRPHDGYQAWKATTIYRERNCWKLTALILGRCGPDGRFFEEKP